MNSKANEQSDRGLLIIISGPSGVGKGTIRRQVMRDRSLRLVYSISMTTRPKRPHEKEGFDYFFVDDEEFNNQLKQGNLLEWAEFVGNRYGTPTNYVEKLRNEGMNVILEIDVVGAKQVMEKLKDDNIVTIFLVPPSFEELKNRINMRKTEPESVIKKRLIKAEREMAMQSQYQYVVINDSVESASKQIQNIIRTKMNKFYCD
jgi:guanylate kinase